MKLFLAALLLLLVGVTGSVSAHPGRTDSSGGHYCRTNCAYWGYDYGEYHYHGYSEPEVDYYDQGYEYGSEDAIDNNHDNIIARAKSSGAEAGRMAGEAGEDAELSLTVPDAVCEIDFEFKANEDQDYIDGVQDGWSDHCPEVADEAYSSAYTEAYDVAYAEYEQQQQTQAEKVIDAEPTSNTDSSAAGWLTLAGVVGFFMIVGNWEAVKGWFKNEK